MNRKSITLNEAKELTQRLVYVVRDGIGEYLVIDYIMYGIIVFTDGTSCDLSKENHSIYI